MTGSQRLLLRLGPVSYVVQTSDQQLWKWYVDQLKEFRDSPIRRSTEFDDENDWNVAGAHADEVCSDTSHASDSPQANPDSLVTDNVEPGVSHSIRRMKKAYPLRSRLGSDRLSTLTSY